MAEPPSMDPTALMSITSAYESSAGGDGSFLFNSKVEGYDYEFVPAPDTRYECAICMLVLREPRQTPCGHRFCRDCILKWLRESHTRCPVDNEELSETDLFADNFAKREIQNFNVRCLNSKQGCDVITTVKQLPAHLNECPLALVPCPNKCGNVLLRRDLEEHVNNICDQRRVQCPDCGDFFFAVELERHIQSCPEGRVRCPHCGEEIIRRMLPSHEDDTCPQKIVLCSFNVLGCEVQVARCELDGHLRDSMTAHMLMLCQGVTKIFQVLHLRPLSQEGVQLPTRELSPTEMSGAMSGMVSTIQQFGQLSIGSGTLHPSFDTKYPPQGNPAYSLPAASQTFRPPAASASLDSASLSASPSGSLLRSSPSDSKHVLSGATSTGTLEASMLKYTSEPSDSDRQDMSPASLGVSGRHDSTSKSLSTWPDEQKLVMHGQTLLELQAKMETLERAYKQKVKLHEQQISDMEGRICNGQFFWKIRNYSRYQREAERGDTTALHSQPFYTSPSGGYKLCVRANLNGVDSARGSHLSLFIHFMQGDYDDVLDWPFSGRIILSVMDQNDCCELRNHVAETLAAKPNLAAFQRPTTPRNHKGFGYMEFLPLSALKHSSYIKNDTLIIKAHVLPNS